MSTKFVLIVAVLLVGVGGTGWFIYNRLSATASAGASAGASAETGPVTVIVPSPDPQAGERLRQAIGKPYVPTTKPDKGTFE